MKNIFKNKLTKVFVTSFLVTCIVGGGATYFLAPPQESIGHASYIFNPANKESLIGFSSNVFEGTVINQVETGEDQGGPYTVYDVKVGENIKGALNDIVKVRQYIGIDKETGTLVKLENDDYLSNGKQYMFSTKYNEEKGFYTIVLPEAAEELKKDNKEKIKDIYKTAKKNEKDPMEKLKEEKEKEDKVK